MIGMKYTKGFVSYCMSVMFMACVWVPHWYVLLASVFLPCTIGQLAETVAVFENKRKYRLSNIVPWIVGAVIGGLFSFIVCMLCTDGEVL